MRGRVAGRKRARRWARWALPILLSSLAPIAAEAAGTFHVDNQNPSASDANPGTPTLPYRTISAAAAAHHGPGTMILVSPGVYREAVTVSASGDSAGPFVFRAAGPGVVVDGSDDFSDPAQWAPDSGTVYRAATVTWSPLQVFVDGARLTPSTAGPAALPANSFQYVAGAGLYVNLGGGSPGDRLTTVGRRTYGFRVTGAWVVVDGFSVTRTEDRAVYLSGASSCTVRNNTVSFCRKYGIYVSGGASNVIERNIVSDHQFHGIGLVSGAAGMIVQDNECFRNADPAAHVANGLYVSASSGNLIQRNRFHDNQDSGGQITAQSDGNLEIQNVSWNNGDAGFGHLSATNSVMIGCVAYGNGDDGISFEGASTGGRVYDCIAANNGLATSRFDLLVSLESAVGFQSDDNLFWNSTGQAPIRFNGTSYATVGAFSAVSGTDARTLQADPRFVDAAAGDFHLRAGSPAIDNANSGMASWPSLDAEGRERQDDPLTSNTGVGPVTYADRGALEYEPQPVPPVAAFTVTPDSGFDLLFVTIDASASSDLDGTIVSYRFDFGDGFIAGPMPASSTITSYTAGTWTVTVTVTDDDGLTGTASRTVTVRTNLAPDAAIERPATDVTIAAGQAVDFTASGADPDGHTPLGFAWDFGGGAPGAEVEDPGPVIFDTPGIYTVELIVADALGLADSTPATRVVTVTPAPTGVPADEIHWTFTGSNSVTLDWRGFDRTVRYGPTAAYGSIATADVPEPLPFSSPGPFREAKLSGLEENTVYHYSIGDGPDHTFRTPPPRGASGFTIFVAGDIGGSNEFETIPPMQAAIAADAPAFVLMVGDLTYGNTTGQASVDQHFNDVMAWSQDAAYMPVWGNHEWDSPEDDLRNYRGRFDLPHPQVSPGSPGPGGEDWSWFDYGNVRFIAYPEPYINTSWPEWKSHAVTLMNDAQADPAIRFIVTFGHRPAYSSGNHRDEGIRAYLDALGDSHDKYVLNLCGHSHDYERTHPQHGVVHITAGTGGSELQMESGSCIWRGGCPPPAWSAFRAMHHVTVRLRFSAGGILGEAICGPSAPGNDVSCAPGTMLDRFEIGATDLPPVVAARATATVDEGGSITLNVTASDPEGTPISSLAASGLPPGASFTAGPGHASGTLTWSPGFAHTGVHGVTFTASNTGSGSATTAITVRNVDRAPAVSAPATAGGEEGTPIFVAVSASDPDGDAIASLTSSGLPVGASFTPAAGNSWGALHWTPGAGQAGEYQVGFTAANALSGSAATILTARVPGAPVVDAPAAVAVIAGSLAVVDVMAFDPDRDPIVDLSAANLPAGASFVVGPRREQGQMVWTPALDQSGTWSVTFTASNALSGSAATRITVSLSGLPPAVVAPPAASVQAGTPVAINVTAADPDGDPIEALTATRLPGAMFTTASGNRSGRLAWTPTVADQGSHTVTFAAANGMSGSASTTLLVTAPNRPPVAALSVSPVTGRAPFTVTADMSGSTDPDGSVAGFTFDFGDGLTPFMQSRAIATHTYPAGRWTLSATVTDNQGGTAVKTLPVMVGPSPGPSNLVGNSSFEHDAHGWGSYQGATVQRVAGGFDGDWGLQVGGPATLTTFGCKDSPGWVNPVPAAGMRYRCTAWVRSQASAGAAYLQLREYLKGNRVGEIQSEGVVLSPAWQLLQMDYVTVAAGSYLDFEVIDEPVAPGEAFVTDDVSIFAISGPNVGVPPGPDPGGRVPLQATVAPHPLRSRSVLSFATSRSGPLRVALYDVAGRRVRTLLDEPAAPAGLHELTLDAKDDRGRALASGLYFYGVRALEGASHGRIVVVR